MLFGFLSEHAVCSNRLIVLVNEILDWVILDQFVQFGSDWTISGKIVNICLPTPKFALLVNINSMMY